MRDVAPTIRRGVWAETENDRHSRTQIGERSEVGALTDDRVERDTVGRSTVLGRALGDREADGLEKRLRVSERKTSYVRNFHLRNEDIEVERIAADRAVRICAGNC